MRTLIKIYKDKLHLLLAVALLYALAAVCELLMPYEMSKIVTEGIKAQNGDVIVKSGIIMAVLAVVSLAVSIISVRINSFVAVQFEKQLKSDLFKKINSLSFEQFSSVGTSGIITRITEDVRTLRDLASQGVFTLVNVPITFIGGVILIMAKDSFIGTIMLCVSPIVLVIAILIARRLDALWQRADEFTDEQNRHVRERLSGIRVLRAFDSEQEKHQKIANATKEMVKSFIRSNVLSGFINPIASVLLNVASVVILYVSASRIGYQSALTAGDVIAAVQYVALLLNGLMMLSWSFAWLPHVGVCLRRINQLFAFKTDEGARSEGKMLSGDIEVKNLCFSYPDSGAKVLCDINFKISSGEKVALIGGTGSGKSTLVKLLLGFYAVENGEISFGGESYSNLKTEDIRKSISVALQKSMIFEGSLRYNVCAGNSNKSDAQVINALQIAEMQDFLQQAENGLDFELKQAGSNLSGGQKQRVNIARAILKDASLYIFDDSFSALDFLTESNLRSKLNEFLKGRSQLIITQRIATARSCDKIYVLNEGKIVGVGTHSQLLENCNIYSELHRSQSGGAYEE